MKIEILRNSKHRGAKVVMVDGEPWGYYSMEQRGVHGNHYNLEDVHHTAILAKGSSWSERYPKKVVVAGTKSANRRSPLGETALPLDERLLIAAEEAVKDERLLPPAQLRAKADEARQNAETARIASEKREAQKMHQRAYDAVNEVLPGDRHNISEDERRALVDSILAAMRWAQTQ